MVGWLGGWLIEWRDGWMDVVGVAAAAVVFLWQENQWGEIPGRLES